MSDNSAKQGPDVYSYYPPTLALEERGLKPHCCPVCHGKGTLPKGFYNHRDSDYFTTSDVAPEKCRTCNGGGILWG